MISHQEDAAPAPGLEGMFPGISCDHIRVNKGRCDVAQALGYESFQPST